MWCRVRGERATHAIPPIRLVSTEEMRSKTDDISPERRTRTAMRNAALSWFGLKGRAAAAPDLTPALGFYSFQDRSIYLLDYPGLLSANAGLFTLAHELVHAIQSASGNATAAGSTTTFDVELAQRALFEGQARYFEQWLRGMVHGYQTDAWREEFRHEPELADEAALRSLAPLDATASLFEFPYGTRLAALVYSRNSRASHPDVSRDGTFALLAARHGWPTVEYAAMPPPSGRPSALSVRVASDGF
jgi:hypothetical protein